MPTTVEFFFGPGSRYSYLAASQLARVEAETGCRFVWRPLRGTELRALRGRDPFAGEPVSGQYDWGYRRRDAEMWAAYYRIPFREPLNHEPFDLLARAAAAGELIGAAARYGRALCELAYASDVWPIDRDACLACADAAGLECDAVAALLDGPAPSQRLGETAREAHERGVFGVPTFLHAGRLYWGNDRLVLLEHALRQETS